MNAATVLVVLAVCFAQINGAKVSEDCLYGRETAATCCESIPEGDPTHLANPKDCGSFYVCQNKYPMLWPCLPGQIWSVQEQICVHSSDPNKCDQVTSRAAIRKVSEDCLWGRESAETCCKTIPEGDSTHLANPKECSSFYLCKNNQPMLWPCLPGQIWSVPEQKCVQSSNTGKCDQVTSRRSTRKVSEDCLWGREDAETCCKTIPEGDSTHLANPEECSSFYLCKNNKPMLWPCLPGQVWSVPEQKCVQSSDTNKCDQVNFIDIARAKVSQNCIWGRTAASKCCRSIPNGDSTHLANPAECSSFFICRNNKPVLYPCPSNQIWNVSEQKCVDSETTDTCEQFA